MALDQLLAANLWQAENCRYSGFQFAAGLAGQKTSEGFAGRLSPSESARLVDSETKFDLASVTKLYTATLAAQLHAAGQIDLDAPLASWSQATEPLANLTIRELLTHTSGLPPWWEEQSSRKSTIEKLFALVPDQQQRGSIVYSCTGYSLFAMLLEQKMGKRFDQILSEQLLTPLGLKETKFNAGAFTGNIAQAKEPEERIGFGLVHDPRARALDGVSGNAGLFASATEVFTFFSAVLSNKVLSDGAREQLFTPTASGEWSQAIGFRHQDAERLGTAANLFSHTGFTGTLVVVDPQTQLVGVMLTNRLVCSTTREQMAPIYRSFAEEVVRSVNG